jgi:hypothetical protein
MTTQTRFTPGPLRVARNGYIGAAGGKEIAVMCTPCSEGDPALFAASPRLYAALEKFVAHYPMGINPFLDEACIEARAALAQARGESGFTNVVGDDS